MLGKPAKRLWRCFQTPLKTPYQRHSKRLEMEAVPMVPGGMFRLAGLNMVLMQLRVVRSPTTKCCRQAEFWRVIHNFRARRKLCTFDSLRVYKGDPV